MVPSAKSAPKTTKEDSLGKEPKGNLADVLKMVMEDNQNIVELVLQQTTRKCR